MVGRKYLLAVIGKLRGVLSKRQAARRNYPAANAADAATRRQLSIAALEAGYPSITGSGSLSDCAHLLEAVARQDGRSAPEPSTSPHEREGGRSRKCDPPLTSAEGYSHSAHKNLDGSHVGDGASTGAAHCGFNAAREASRSPSETSEHKIETREH
jgi:hypothetical protein